MSDPRYIYRPMLDLIGVTEGTAKHDGYNETLAYGALTGGDVALVTMTLDQVDALQGRMLAHPDNRWNSSAAGMYQIVRTTLRRIRQTLELSGGALFDAAMQDRMGCFLLGLRGIDRWLDGEISEDTLINELAKEWASLPTTRDVGHYSGQYAAVKSGRVREVLAQVRARHLAAGDAAGPVEAPHGPSLPETATIEAVTALAQYKPDRLAAAARAIALARAMQDGWTINDARPLAQTPAQTPGLTFTQPQESDMNGLKSWFQSKSVLGGLAALGALIGPVFGLDLGSTNINDATLAINDLIAAVGALVAIWGRVTAKSQIKPVTGGG